MTMNADRHEEPVIREVQEIASDDAVIAQLSEEMAAARIALAEIERRYEEAVRDTE
jgi:hypothetical protein